MIFVELEVEKAVFHESSNQLRIQGTVTAAKPEELVPLKAHHTLEAEIGKKITLVVMDDEEAEIAFLKDTGLEVKARIIAQREGKMFKSGEKHKAKPYFEELL